MFLIVYDKVGKKKNNHCLYFHILNTRWRQILKYI